MCSVCSSAVDKKMPVCHSCVVSAPGSLVPTCPAHPAGTAAVPISTVQGSSYQTPDRI